MDGSCRKLGLEVAIFRYFPLPWSWPIQELFLWTSSSTLFQLSPRCFPWHFWCLALCVCKLGDAAIWQSEPVSWLPRRVAGGCWLELTGNMAALPKLSTTKTKGIIHKGRRDRCTLAGVESPVRHPHKACYLLTLAFMLHAPFAWGPSLVSNYKQQPPTHCWQMTRVLRSRVVQRCLQLQPLPVNEDNGTTSSVTWVLTCCITKTVGCSGCT